MEETSNIGGSGEDKNKEPKETTVDLDKILLPKKDARPPQMPERVNAGVLLEQEQNASLPKTEPQPQAQAPAQPKLEGSTLPHLQTFQSDIEKVVSEKNVSVVSIAAAEAARRNQAPQFQGTVEAEPQSAPFWNRYGKQLSLVLGGVTLLGISALLLIYTVPFSGPVDVEVLDRSRIITVDETKVFVVPPGEVDHNATIAALNRERGNLSLSLGLIAHIYLAQASTTPEGEQTLKTVPASRILQLISPSVPQELLRDIEQEEYLFAFHSVGSIEPLLVLRSNRYEQAFAAMLEWEHTMKREFSKLFEQASTEQIATDIGTTTPAPIQTVVNTGFVDRVVENHDARAIVNERGEILLLWTFLDRNTILITTNETTVREIISRLRTAPIESRP